MICMGYDNLCAKGIKMCMWGPGHVIIIHPLAPNDMLIPDSPVYPVWVCLKGAVSGLKKSRQLL